MSKKELIDYSKYLTRRAAPLVEDFDGKNWYPDCVEDNKKAEEYNKKYFYGRRGFCPFCKQEIPKIHNKLKKESNYYDVWSCKNCGWWEIEKTESYGIPAIGHPTTQEYHFQAIVRSFDVDDKKLPLDVLLYHIRKEENILYDIHPRKMEEIVKYVFNNYFSCDVIHCGKSHDGGVDLIMIDSDSSKTKKKTKLY